MHDKGFDLVLRGFIIDLDGVVWRRNSIIPGCREAITELRESGKQVIFVSNNSLLSRAEVLNKLHHFGIPASLENIIVSPYATARFISEERPGARVFVVGMSGLRNELIDAGLQIVSQPQDADYLVAGYDSDLSYGKLALALQALLAGAKFIATNDDGILPTESGYMPGAGATVGALKGMVKREPDVTIGKPNDFMARAALEIMGIEPAECAFVGDSLQTDILLANNLGMCSILVLTGNTRSTVDVYNSSVKPGYILTSVAEIPRFLSCREVRFLEPSAVKSGGGLACLEQETRRCSQ